MNGDTIKEVKALLQDKGAIPTKTALRLSLDLQKQIYEKLEEHEEKQKEYQRITDESIKRLERNSILLWVQSNPKTAAFLLTLYLIISALVDFEKVLALALGVKFP